MLYFMTYLWVSIVFIPFVIFFTLNTIVTLKKLSKARKKNISNLLVVIYTYIRTNHACLSIWHIFHWFKWNQGYSRWKRLWLRQCHPRPQTHRSSISVIPQLFFESILKPLEAHKKRRNCLENRNPKQSSSRTLNGWTTKHT